jgi:anti-sigma factor RsiW
MKNCLNDAKLQAWLDGELSHQAFEDVRSHLAACSRCASRADEAKQVLALVDDAWQAEFPSVVPTTRLLAGIEKGLAAQPATGLHWKVPTVFAHWRLAGAAAVIAIAITGGFMVRVWQSKPEVVEEVVRATEPAAVIPPEPTPSPTGRASTEPASIVKKTNANRPVDLSVRRPARRPGRLESETARHLGQTQMLLRSVRNADPESTSGLDYERDLARELLSRNRLLRRMADHKVDKRIEELLVDVEPLLLDIANLPGEPAPEEMRSLSGLIRDQQIIVELQLYVGKSGF